MLKHLSKALTLLVIALSFASLTQSPAGATKMLDRDCGDFPSQAAAQNFFNSLAGDPHGLDADGNGIACESNPCPCIGRGNPGPQNPTNPPPQQPAPDPIRRETGNVTAIVDGDTLKVRLRNGPIVSVRMLGINTPERGRCGYGEASDNLRKLAPVGSTVHLVSDRTQALKDRYGRLLRYVARQGGFKDLSYRQAWNGFTKPYVFGGKPVARHRDYVRAINNARNNARGLWSGCW
ncbi:thermonuclease family protein [Nocardioides sp. SYSU D00065]|uniref:thermonuclease family protein n=1 Tax=Nocardioides sp. SYSU D00065 TaxID=2817378 RepID=UPI001B3447CE|nr:thermonuclease family protein [Nocardioides sp. SYSU D00065]